MSTRPRTPVHFPKMKVRGARNKAKSAARYRYASTARVRIGSQDASGTTLILDPNGTHVVSGDSGIQDGWGRLIAPPTPPVMEAKPRPAFSMSFQMEPGAADLLAALYGEAS